MSGPAPLRLALVADVHHGPFVEAKDGPAALPLLEAAVAEVSALSPALVVDLGDRITETTPAEDVARFAEAARPARALRVPWVYLPGNHDLAHLSLEHCEAVLGTPLQPHSADLAGWHLVFWAIDPRQQPEGRRIAQADLEWLEADLRATALPAVIFTHIPLHAGSMAGNYYFARGVPGGPAYVNAGEARAVLERTDRVVLAVAGHVHWNSLATVDGIHYVTVQSLSETSTTHPHPAGAWAVLDLATDWIRLEVRGRDPLRLELPVRRRGHHWLPPAGPPAVTPAAPGAMAARAAPDVPVVAVSDRAGPLSGVRGVILDLDGVVYSGSRLLPGVAEFLAFLRDTGRRMVAVTNHSGLSVQGYAEKLARLGVPIPASAVLTSGWAAAHYLRRNGTATRVFVLGSEGLRTELLAAGCVEATSPEVVVVGYDPALDLDRLVAATRHVLTGARLVGTNADALLPTPEGPVPECGPILAFLEAATGRRAEVIGKPGTFIVEQALARLGLLRDEVLIIGDTVDTDIAAGLAAGIRTALVLTGNAARPPIGERQPTVTVPDLHALRALLSRHA